LTGAARRLVDHALGLAWDDVPEAAREAARTFLHDTLCVGVAGSAAPNAEAILSVARSWGESAACQVLGRDDIRLPAPSSAFVNAFQIHCQEFDCVHEPAVLHPLATIVAALAAEAERSGPYDGERFLISLIAGVDVAVALGLAARSPLRFFRPATAGVFGSVAALARLRGLDAATAQDGFGYALAFASGTMQAHLEGKPALALQVANAARSAIVATDLAVAGLAGPQASIDGPFGYLSLFEERFDLGPVLAELADVRRIAEVSWKPYPTGRAAHGGLTAVARLAADHAISGRDLDSLVMRAPPLIKRLVGRPPIPGMDVAYARLCLPWLAASALTYGEVGLADFGPERRSDPALLSLARRISVVEDGGVDPAAFTPLRALARTTDGREAQVEVASMLGAPADPLSREQHLHKARRCLAFAGVEDRHEAFAEAIARIDQAPDVATALFPRAPEARTPARSVARPQSR
jgi:2-methylcitrate dehydratase PrpD